MPRMKINKNQFVLSSKLKHLKWSYNRAKGHFLRYLYNRFKWHYYPKWHYTSRFPDHIDIEATNACNMKCPMCYRHVDKFNAGLMDWKLYKKIIDEAAANRAYSIKLSWRGEVLVHPRLIHMIQYARKKGIKEISFLTNALALDEDIARKIVESRVDWVTVSFDGIGEIYEKIRYPAKYGEAVARLKKLQEIKKEMKTDKPVLTVQTIWPAIRDNPEPYYDVFDRLADMISVNPYKEYTDIVIPDPEYQCPVMWHRMTITWNGDVPQCICDTDTKNIIGNVRQQSIREIWRSKKYIAVRKQHIKDRLKLPVCKNCFEGAKMEKFTLKVRGLEIPVYRYLSKQKGRNSLKGIIR